MSSHRYSAALTSTVHDELASHLLREDGDEDLCFAVWYPSQGKTRLSALIAVPILPEEGERLVHGNASFQPHYFERALAEAMRLGGGLGFLHSHPGPGWQAMSRDDVQAERGHAAAAKASTGLPLVGLTLGTDGAWSARFWMKAAPRIYERQWCENVRVVGRKLAITWHPELRPTPSFRPSLLRTISAWGEAAQADFARLHIGVVGAGSVGSMVAEALVRTGNEHIDLLDFDSIEQKNLDRLLHATEGHIGKAKVDVLAVGLRKGATGGDVDVRASEWSVVEDEGFLQALDCDVLFSCVDRPWPRSAMNYAAYAHLIPVVDGGIQVTVTKRGTLKSADWRAHIAAPMRRCLECVGQYNAGDVSLERDGRYDDAVYIAGLPKDHPMRANENVFAFSMSVASLEVLQLLMMVVAPSSVSSPGAQLYHFVPGFMDESDHRGCEDRCIYRNYIARGDRGGLTVTAKHARAEEARAARAGAPVIPPDAPPRAPFWARLRAWVSKGAIPHQ
jgi:hypothetical protein